MGFLQRIFGKKAVESIQGPPMERTQEEQGSALTVSEGDTEAENLLYTLLGACGGMTREKALQIPAVSACLDLIKGTMRTIPLKLYKKNEEGFYEEIEDYRIKLLTVETGDTLNASQMWDAIVEDYFLSGNAYIYINRIRNKIISLHYVNEKEVSTVDNAEPIFKDYDIYVRDKIYRPYDFLKILRNTTNGAYGDGGIVNRNSLQLQVAYNYLDYENENLKAGGKKKGFLKLTRKFADVAKKKMAQLFRSMYQSKSESVVVLDEGADFKEATNTAVEMQLNENKKTNSISIFEMFNIPAGMMNGAGTSGASADDRIKFIDECICPFLEVIKCALNRDLLLESEKELYTFDFDCTSARKGDILKQYQAYEIAIRTGIMQVDEVRSAEKRKPIGFDYYNINLSSVLYDKENEKIIVPNMGTVLDLKKMEKGEEFNGAENQEQ